MSNYFVQGQIVMKCPICGEDVTIAEDSVALPDHTYCESIRVARGCSASLPQSIEIKCIASGGKINWR